jgi:hypothetical protein
MLEKMKGIWIQLRWIVAAVIYIYFFSQREWIWMQGILVLIWFIYSLVDLTSESPEDRIKLIEKEERIKELEERVKTLEDQVKDPDNY